MKTNNFRLPILMILCLAFTGHGLRAQNDFRKVSWGADMAKVKSAESCNLAAEDRTKIVYDCSLAGIKGKIVYVFTLSGQLMRAKYFLTPDYMNMTNYVRDYKMFLGLLTNKYGEMDKRTVVSLTDKQNTVENEWPAMLAAGLLRVEAVWNMPNTRITLTLSKVGDNPAVQIDYVSVKLTDVDLKEKKDSIMDEL